MRRTGSTLPTRRGLRDALAPGAATVGLAPPGPAWFGVVMGTALLATLLRTHPVLAGAATGAAPALLILAWLVLLGLVATMIIRAVGDPATLRATWHGAAAAQWGMVSMGVLAVGAATVAVVPVVWPGLTGVAWAVDHLTWVVGTAIGAATALGFTGWLLSGDRGTPATTWGLAVVPPMVSATTGAAIAGRHADPGAHLIMVAASTACFAIGLLLGALVFAVAYHHHLRIAPLGPATATSAWIPLGVVGQSTAAAQVIAEQAGAVLVPSAAAALDRLAVGFGTVMLVLAIPVAGWAIHHTLRGVRARMPFTPGWWAMTFPIGTVSLGAYHLARRAELPALEVVGVACCVVLIGTWAWCTTATVGALSRSRRRRAPG